MRLAPPLAALALVAALAGCSAVPPAAAPADVDCEERAAEWGSEAVDPGDLPAPLSGVFSIEPTCLLQSDPGKFSALWYGASEEQIQTILEEGRAAVEADGMTLFMGEDGEDEMWAVERDGDIDSIMFDRWSDRFELETDLNATLG